MTRYRLTACAATLGIAVLSLTACTSDSGRADLPSTSANTSVPSTSPRPGPVPITGPDTAPGDATSARTPTTGPGAGGTAGTGTPNPAPTGSAASDANTAATPSSGPGTESSAADQAPYAVMPNVSGDSLADAARTLSKAGIAVTDLTYVSRSADNASTRYGHVIATTPPAKAGVRHSDDVTLITPAAADAPMPDIVGVPWRQGLTRLAKAGIQPTAWATSPGGKPGTITATSVAAGDTVAAGSPLTLTVAADAPGTVPSLESLPVSLAFRLAIDAGYTPSFRDPRGAWDGQGDWLVAKVATTGTPPVGSTLDITLDTGPAGGR